MNEWLSMLGLGSSIPIAGAWWAMRQRHLHLWLPEYLRAHRPSHAASIDRPLNVFLSVCDHYEPEWGNADRRDAVSRVDRWCELYPQLFADYRDCLGRAPQHSFFFPQDQYQPEYLDRLVQLCDDGFGDVDVHLHHDSDTEAGLTDKLSQFRDTLYDRHGLLRRCPRTGRIVYGFIHGNWALCNSRPDGRWCGVDREIEVLLETGCYADFTLPSAPSATQTSTVNSLYYATQQDGPKSHNRGIRAKTGQQQPDDSLLMVQGPLSLDWKNRKFGLLPRIENSDIHAGMAPSWRRMQMWMESGVHVAGRPDWIFIKLHTHGCKPGNLETLLGDPTVRFHESLRQECERNPAFKLHYVTAWETSQLIHAAESGVIDPSRVLCPDSVTIDARLRPTPCLVSQSP